MKKDFELNEKELEKVNGGVVPQKSSRELEDEREELVANKPAYTTVKDEDLLNEMKLPDFNLNEVN